jgi:hypothetical protein
MSNWLKFSANCLPGDISVTALDFNDQVRIAWYDIIRPSSIRIPDIEQLMPAMKKNLLFGAVLVVFAAAHSPAGAWTMAFSETQRSPNLSLEMEAGKPGSSVGIKGAKPDALVYEGWALAARPDAVRRLYGTMPGGEQRVHFAGLVDKAAIGLVDMDAAVAGHLLAPRVDARSRFDMPVLSDAKWSDMRPRDAKGHILTWEALKRVKSWLGGTGATITVASLVTSVPEPATVALLIFGLISLIVLRRRRTAP